MKAIIISRSYIFVAILLLLFCTFVNAEPDHYTTLGIPRDASNQQIRQAYKKLALKWHPDKNPGDKAAEEKYIEVSNAYEVLSDEQKRKEYDQFGSSGNRGQQRSQQHWGFGGGGTTFEFHFGGGGGFRNFFTRNERKSEITYLTNHNFDHLIFSNDDAIWITYFCSDWYHTCNELSNIMEDAYKSLKGFVQIGYVDVETQRRLAHRYSVDRIPTIISFVNGRPEKYVGELSTRAIVDYGASKIPDIIHRIRKKSEWTDFIASYPDKVKVLLVSDKDQASLLYKSAAIKYQKSMVFAQARLSNIDNELRFFFDISRVPTIVVQRESISKPIITTETFNKESLLKYLDQFQFLLVPQLERDNFNPLCQTKYCVVYLSNGVDHESTMTELQKLSLSIELKGIVTISVVWVDSLNQEDFTTTFINMESLPRIVLVHYVRQTFLLYDEEITSDDLLVWVLKAVKGSIRFQKTPKSIPDLKVRSGWRDSLFDLLDLYGRFVSNSIINIISMINLEAFLVLFFLIYPLTFLCSSNGNSSKSNNTSQKRPGSIRKGSIRTGSFIGDSATWNPLSVEQYPTIFGSQDPRITIILFWDGEFKNEEPLGIFPPLYQYDKLKFYWVDWNTDNKKLFKVFFKEEDTNAKRESFELSSKKYYLLAIKPKSLKYTSSCYSADNDDNTRVILTNWFEKLIDGNLAYNDYKLSSIKGES